MANRTLPDGITLADLKENYQVCETYYSKAFKRANILDATDRGRIWEAVGAKFPAYQVLSDTNHTARIKTQLLANLYSVSRCPNILPSSDKDKDLIMQLNIALEREWSSLDIGFFQMQAGSRAALLNVGYTQIGWDPQAKGGGAKTNSWFLGKGVLKNIDPLHFMRDPFAKDLESAGYAMTWDNYHKIVLKRSKRWKEGYEAYVAKNKNSFGPSPVIPVEQKTDVPGKLTNAGATPNQYIVYTNWMYDDKDNLYEIDTLAFDEVLDVRGPLEPSIIPVIDLYCNLPEGDVIGTSEPAKTFANSLAYNLIRSILFTAEYKNQRPPRFISAGAQININSFKKYGNEADATFVVSGDASKAVHYHQYPQPSAQATVLAAATDADIDKVTGIDDRYTGRDTGSILTTGGTEAMLDQVTLVDQPKIVNYNRYAKKLAQLLLFNLIKKGGKRKYFIKNPTNPKKYKEIEVNFSDVDIDTLFDYEIDISPMLPKNKIRLSQMANTLMEKQLQYGSNGQNIDLITPEEWLMFQDIPVKEYMMERMGIQRQEEFLEMAAQIVFEYASLVDNGMKPEDALMATAETMRLQKQGGQDPGPITPDPTVPVAQQQGLAPL